MKNLEKMWIKLIIFSLIFNAFWVWMSIISKTNVFICLIHVFNMTIIISIYSIIHSKKIRSLEENLPKKGEECFCYVYYVTGGDNGSIIYSVVAHVKSENQNKMLKYQTFTNLKLKSNQIVKGYYYNNKVVLDKKDTAINKLPKNIIDAFELNKEVA